MEKKIDLLKIGIIFKKKKKKKKKRKKKRKGITKNNKSKFVISNFVPKKIKKHHK